MRSRQDFGKFLNARGLVGTGVEVGVWRGEFSLQILNAWAGRRLFLVDAWAPQSPTEYQDIHNVSAARHAEILREIPQRLQRHAGRFQIVQATSEQAAGRFENNALDFVYIDANHKYGAVARDLELWYPKVKNGGVFAGFGYLDGVIDRCLFGVKTALDEFSDRLGIQAQLTYDKLPTWFFAKNNDRQPTSRSIALLTAYDANQAQLAKWSSPNKRVYCERHGYRFIERTDGFERSRHPVWSKMKFIKEHLAEVEWLFWSDADSLIMDQTRRLEEFIDDEYDAVITQEDLGTGLYNLNAGQMFFRNCEWSLKFQDQIWAQTQFLNDQMREQRAIIHLWEQHDLSDRIQVVCQRRFNSYLSNYRKGDFLLHFPDIPNPDRVRLLQTFVQFTKD